MMLTRKDIIPHARRIARILGVLHGFAALYCMFNLVRHFEYFVSVGTGDFVFFASYLTLAFACCGSLVFIGYVAGKVPFGIAILGCLQAALCAVGLSLFQETLLDGIVLIFYGTSGFILKYTIPEPGAANVDTAEAAPLGSRLFFGRKKEPR